MRRQGTNCGTWHGGGAFNYRVLEDQLVRGWDKVQQHLRWPRTLAFRVLLKGGWEMIDVDGLACYRGKGRSFLVLLARHKIIIGCTHQ